MRRLQDNHRRIYQELFRHGIIIQINTSHLDGHRLKGKPVAAFDAVEAALDFGDTTAKKHDKDEEEVREGVRKI